MSTKGKTAVKSIRLSNDMRDEIISNITVVNLVERGLVYEVHHEAKNLDIIQKAAESAMRRKYGRTWSTLQGIVKRNLVEDTIDEDDERFHLVNPILPNLPYNVADKLRENHSKKLPIFTTFSVEGRDAMPFSTEQYVTFKWKVDPATGRSGYEHYHEDSMSVVKLRSPIVMSSDSYRPTIVLDRRNKTEARAIKMFEKVNEQVRSNSVSLREVKNVMYSVNTTKQLLELWPEVEKFLTPYLSNPSNTTLPAVNIKRVNEILGW